MSSSSRERLLVQDRRVTPDRSHVTVAGSRLRTRSSSALATPAAVGNVPITSITADPPCRRDRTVPSMVASSRVGSSSE